jgi:hypothetical protein
MKSKCINPNNSVILELAEKLGKSKYETAIDVEIWQENNNTSKIPSANDLAGKVNYQLPSTEGQVASEKTIRDLAARIADRIGMKVKFESDRTKEYKGKIENNVAYVNLAYATLDTPIHEILGHPIIRAIKNKYKTSTFEADEDTPFGGRLKEEDGYSQLYQNLLKELETGKGKEVLNRIKRDYDLTGKYELVSWEEGFKSGRFSSQKSVINEGWKIGDIEIKNGISYYKIPIKYTLEEQQEEAIVELLGLMTAEKLDKVKDGKLISLLKRLLKEMKAFMKQLLGQKEVEIDKLPDNMTINDLADLLAYSNSKLILPGYEVLYTTPDNKNFRTYQEASNHISQLAKNVKDVNLDNVELGGNQEVPENLKWEFENQGKTYKELIENKQWKISDDTGNTQIVANQEYNGEKGGLYWDGKNYYHLSNIDNKKTIIPFKEFVELFSKIKQFGTNKDKLFQDRIVELSEYEQERINPFKEFINKNKEYEQSKEIIEEWKKVNNIKYNPEEIYSRGQEFSSVVGAYSDFDVNLMMQNLLQHIEDNEKAGGKFAISAYTKPIDKQIGHLEGGGGKIKFKLYPQSEDILWAANTDVYSGSVWDASEKVNKDKKSELLGVSYTKYPSLQNVNTVQPNLASIVDDLAHHHNELGIVLTGNNFRLEYDDNIPYQTKKIINGINSILDQKYGKLVKPEININNNVKYEIEGYSKQKFDSKEKAESVLKDLKNTEYGYKYGNIFISPTGIQPTQTKDNLKESIESVKSKVVTPTLTDWRIIKGPGGQNMEWAVEYRLDEDVDLEFFDTEQEARDFIKNLQNKKVENKEYTEQALINTKIAALKEVAKKYPRSLIRSEVIQTKIIIDNPIRYNLFEDGETPFQKIPFNDNQIQAVNSLLNLQGKQEQFDDYYKIEGFNTELKRPSSLAKAPIQGREYVKTAKEIKDQEIYTGMGNLAHAIQAEIVRKAFPEANSHIKPLEIVAENAGLFEIINEQIQPIIEKAKKNGSILMSEVFVGNLKLKRGGTIDLLEVMKDGNYKIYDLKTRFTPDTTFQRRYNKLGEFTKQLQEYKNILTEGDENIGIEPGKVDSAVILELDLSINRKTGEFLGKGKRGSELVAPFFLRTGDEKLDKFITTLKGQIDQLKNKIPKGEAEKEAHYKLLNSKLALMQELQLRQTATEIIIHAGSEVSALEAFINSDENVNGEDIISELKLYSDLSDFVDYDKLPENLKNQMDIIESRAKRLYKKLLERSKEVVVDTATKKIGAKFIDILFSPIKDISWLKRMVSGISNTSNPLVATGYKVLTDALALGRSKLDNLKEHIVPIIEEYRKAVGSLDYSIILTDDKKRLVSQWSQEFYKEKQLYEKSMDAVWAKENMNYDKQAFEEAYERKIKYLDSIKNREIAKIKSWLMLQENQPEDLDKVAENIYWSGTKTIKGRKEEISEWLAKNENNRYIYYTPKSKWIDSKWKEIKQGKWKGTGVEKFYDFYTNYMKIANEIAPDYIAPTFIANFSQNFLERSTDLGLIGAIKGSYSELLNNLQLEYDENLFGKTDPTTGERILEMFIPGMSKAKQDKSLDLGVSLMTFMEGVYRYQELSQIENTINHIKLQIRNASEQKIDALGNPITDSTKTTSQINPAKHISAQFEAAVDAILYNKRQEEEGAFELKGNGLTQALGLLKKEDSVNISYSKIFDVLIKYTGLRNLSFNVFAPLSNLIGGVSNMYMSGFGGQYYSTENLNKAFNLLTISKSGLGSEESLKARLFLNWLEIDKEKVEREIFSKITNSQISAITKKYNGMSLMRNSENLMVEAGAIAMLESGKHGLTIDDFEIKDGKLVVKDNISINEKEKFRQKVMRVNGKTIGSMNPDDLLMGKKWIVGRMLLQHRGWLPQLAYERFGSKQFDYILEKDIEGRYRVAYRALKSLVQNKSLKELSADELAIAKEAFAELILITAIGAILMAMGGLDDEEKKKNWYKYSHKIAMRGFNELIFFADPTLSSQFQIILSPAPAISTIQQSGKTIRDIWREVAADMYDDPEKIRKKAQPLKKIISQLPAGNQVQRIIDEFFTEEKK